MLHPVHGRTLLVVEDDVSLAREIASYFSDRGNTVHIAPDLETGKKLLHTFALDALLLDLRLPDGDGMELLHQKRYIPTIILSCLGDDDTILEGFLEGAADYIVKPISLAVLEARLSLRLLPPEKNEVTLHGLTIHSGTRTVRYQDRLVPMTSSEFNILWFFMNHPGEYYDADSIYVSIWEAPSLKQATVRNHLSRLRRKLLECTGKNLIVTEFGKGYALQEEKQT